MELVIAIIQTYSSTSKTSSHITIKMSTNILKSVNKFIYWFYRIYSLNFKTHTPILTGVSSSSVLLIPSWHSSLRPHPYNRVLSSFVSAYTVYRPATTCIKELRAIYDDRICNLPFRKTHLWQLSLYLMKGEYCLFQEFHNSLHQHYKAII